MRKGKRGVEKGARLGAVLLVLVTLLVIFFTASFVLRAVREVPRLVQEPIPAGIRVEVLNGSGQDRIARKVASALRQRGFDVVNIDNAESHDFAKTIVVDRVSSDMDYAMLLARRIGCDEVAAEPDPSLHLEVTVIIGSDFGKFFPEVLREDRR